jgi:Zn-dependent metalloprotease
MRSTTRGRGRFMWMVIGALLLAGRFATAAPAGAVTGHGSRGDWSVTANVHLQPDGAVRGHLQIRGRLQDTTWITCRYFTFRGVVFLVNQARFDASGTCEHDTSAGHVTFVAENRIVIADNGEPGAGRDTLDVTFLGSAGVAVPGGVIDRGNFNVRPTAEPSLNDLQLTALRRLRAASRTVPEVRFEHGFPRGVLAQIPVRGADPVQRARLFLDDYRDLYRLHSPQLHLGVRRVAIPPELGIQTVTFFQTVQGFPVHGGEIVVVLKDDVLYATTGALVTSDVRLNPVPELTATDAENQAREYAGVRAGAIAGRTELSETSFCYWNTTEDDHIGDEDDIDDEFESDPDAVNARAFSRSTYNFYRNTFGRDSYDDDGNEFEIFIHAKILDDDGNEEVNAGYFGRVCWVGEEGFEFSDGMVQDDVMTHEITHGVVHYGSNLAQGNLPGTLNESLSDIFAFFHTNDPVIGENSPISSCPDLPGGRGIRDVSNPQNCGDRDRWSERFIGSLDNGGVHLNAGITNKAAFLLARGGTHPDTGIIVQGVGDAITRDLFYLAMKFMPSNADPFVERDAVLAFAAARGHGPSVIQSIKTAFTAVEVGVTQGDLDGDSVGDGSDNCRFAPNPGQEDQDGDEIGDSCDTDVDGDGFTEAKWCTTPQCLLTADNCPGVANPDQLDANFNHIGAACDPAEDGDLDNDHVLDKVDNCPGDYNPKNGRGIQPDMDGDGEGDACDPDGDNDTVPNDSDNCIDVANTDQSDIDGDLIGDACDRCAQDRDLNVTWGYFQDPVSGEVHFQQFVPDTDGDGIPDACDATGMGETLVQVDGAPYTSSVGPRPDGIARAVRITADPGTVVSLPVPLCLGECPAAPPPDACMAFEFTGLSPDVMAAVTDEQGEGVGGLSHRIPGGTVGFPRILRAQPRGGRQYSLTLSFSPTFPGETAFTLVQRPCLLVDRTR